MGVEGHVNIQQRGEIMRDRIMDVIHSFWIKNNYAPTIRDISAALDAPTTTVKHHVDVLEQQGRLLKEDNEPRTMRPKGMTVSFQEPFKE